MTTAPLPDLLVQLELGPPLSDGGTDGLGQVERGVHDAVTHLMRRRGLPGDPVVEATWNAEADSPLALHIDGRRVPFPREAVWFARSGVAGDAAVSADPLSGPRGLHAVETVVRVVEEAVGSRASVLLTPAAAEHYLQALDLPASVPSSRVREAL